MMNRWLLAFGLSGWVFVVVWNLCGGDTINDWWPVLVWCVLGATGLLLLSYAGLLLRCLCRWHPAVRESLLCVASVLV